MNKYPDPIRRRIEWQLPAFATSRNERDSLVDTVKALRKLAEDDGGAAGR